MRFLSWLARRLSGGAVIIVSRWLGWLSWFLLRPRRRVVLANLERAFGLPAASRRRLGRRVYDQLGRTALELLRLPDLAPERARELLGARNIARLRELLGAGRGLIVVSAHIGSFDLLACCAGLARLPINVVTRTIKASGIDRYWMETRSACGVKLLPARGGARRVIEALRDNEIVALMLDQHEPGGLEVPFFGSPAATSTTPARLARMTGAPVVAAFLLRRGSDHELVLTDSIPYLEREKTVDAVRANTEEYTRIIEDQIRECPEQWFWVHRRWKVASQAGT